MAEENMKDFEQETNESLEAAKKVESEDDGKWEHLRGLVESKEQFDVKIIEAAKRDYIVYLEDTRTFIPTSQFSSSYVEKLKDYVDKHVTVVVITAGPEEKCLVLSHRAIEREKKEKEKAVRLAELKVGDILDGKVKSLKDYGASVDLGSATGLPYISQISRKRVKTLADVLKEDQEIKVKITKIGDGEISLSMRILEEPDDYFSDKNNTLEGTGGFKHKERARVMTNLGDPLKNVKL